ncbi:MAG: OmpA family protein [Actinomycetia bacterium]|nr:OmpA family protein [Actinomycetes bacterium]
MAGSSDGRGSGTATEWRAESRYYRRAPGWGWLLGLLLIPLLFGWLGWGALKPAASVSAPNTSATAPSMSTPTLNFSPLSILRNGNDFTLSGILPDLAVKNGLLAALKAALGGGVNLIDKIDIAAGAVAPDFDGFSALFTAAADIPNFQFTVEGATMTLTGTAPSEDVMAAVEAAARAGWPNVQIINAMTVAGAAPSCDNLQATIDASLAAPVKFQTGSDRLTADGRQQLAPVIAAVKECQGTRLTVIGHTDNTGNDAINNPLSENRAQSVEDYLVAQGIPADSVTSQGAGSTEPMAGNDTDAGRAQNRRTEIMVG